MIPRRCWPVIALLCAGALLSTFTFHVLRSVETEKSKAMFQRAAQQRFQDIRSDLDIVIAEVVALGAHCEISENISRAYFEGFAKPVIEVHEARLQALEWLPRVPREERASFEEHIRAEGIPGFQISDHGPDGRLARAEERETYYPITYIEPFDGNEIVPGYDPAQDPMRSEVLRRANATGVLAASGRIRLLQRTNAGGYGILLFRPVYRRYVAQGRRELRGFAEGVLSISSLVEQHGKNSGVAVSVLDLSAGTPERQLYSDAGTEGSERREFVQYQTILIGGRTWQLVASPVPGAFAVDESYSVIGAAVCMGFTVLLSMYVTEAQNGRLQVERVVEARTAELKAAVLSLSEVSRGLKESEQRYRQLVESSPNGIVVEREGKIILVNRTAESLLKSDDLKWRSILEFFSPERRIFAEEALRELYSREHQIASRETKLQRSDGTIFDAEVSSSSFSLEGAQCVQVLLRDISHRKSTLAEKARLIRAVEQVGESIMITDAEARIVYVNPAFEKISGYSRDEVLGKNPSVLKSGRQSADFYADVWAALKAGESWSGRFVNRTKNGRLYTEEATISPMVDRMGRITNFVAVKRDVTLETELQEQLHQAQKMDAIGRLAGGVAHDFNNMLMVIISYAELLSSSLPIGDPLGEYTEQILRAATRSAALTRQLLTFSRKQVLAPQIIDCNEVVGDTSKMIRRLISENIELRCTLAPELWKIKADADQIVQVLLNLCVNARDAMPDGGVLTLETRNYQLDSGFVEISVSDTGVGIAPELQEKLFEPFFTTKERGKGTGLGLATVYSIVQQSGGNIRVESSIGHGATFRIYLPRCRDVTEKPRKDVGPRRMASRGTVLVVEDEDSLRQAIADHLLNEGYQVLTALDGVEALEIMADHPEISTLITDLVMPRMGGQELVSELARRFPHVQVILMSGYEDEDVVSREELALFPHLQKPFGMSSLLDRIAEAHA